MDIKSFDNKCIRLTDFLGDTYEGTASYESSEYVSHEYGTDQEALLITPMLFCKDDIVSIESLEEVDGPYGHYSGPYGLLEMKCLESGTDLIEEILDSEDDEAIHRMLLCMQDCFDEMMKRAVPGEAPWRTGGTLTESCDDSEEGPVYLGELVRMLDNIVKYNGSEENISASKDLLERVKYHIS